MMAQYKGNMNMLEKNLQLSQEQFTLALSYMPDDVSTLVNRGVVFFVQKNYNSALQDLRRANSLNPKLLSVHQNLLLVYKATGDLAGAQTEQNIIAELQRITAAPAGSNAPDSVPNGAIQQTRYGYGTYHNFIWRWSGTPVTNAHGFACGATSPTKSTIENVVYFSLPTGTWSRLLEGQYAWRWTNLSTYTQDYRGQGRFAAWTFPPGAPTSVNYAALIQERDVCTTAPSAPSGYRITYWVIN